MGAGFASCDVCAMCRSVESQIRLTDALVVHVS